MLLSICKESIYNIQAEDPIKVFILISLLRVKVAFYPISCLIAFKLSSKVPSEIKEESHGVKKEVVVEIFVYAQEKGHVDVLPCQFLYLQLILEYKHNNCIEGLMNLL